MVSGELWGRGLKLGELLQGPQECGPCRSSRSSAAPCHHGTSLGAGGTVLGFGSVSGPRRPCIWREPIPGKPRRTRGAWEERAIRTG